MLEKLVPSLTKQEKVSIANLIGTCPLALDILGGLFKSNDAPSAKQLMEIRLIKTLNRSELTPERRLDICINCAYDFTPPELKILAQNLSQFPGSFDQPSAFEIVFNLTAQEISNPSQQRDDSEEQLKRLAKRLLLQFSDRTERYHFHKIIQQIFLKNSDNWLFHLRFQ